MSTNICTILGSQVYNASYESVPHLTSHFILAPSLKSFFPSITQIKTPQKATEQPYLQWCLVGTGLPWP